MSWVDLRKSRSSSYKFAEKFFLGCFSLTLKNSDVRSRVKSREINLLSRELSSRFDAWVADNSPNSRPIARARHRARSLTSAQFFVFSLPVEAAECARTAINLRNRALQSAVVHMSLPWLRADEQSGQRWDRGVSDRSIFQQFLAFQNMGLETPSEMTPITAKGARSDGFICVRPQGSLRIFLIGL